MVDGAKLEFKNVGRMFRRLRQYGDAAVTGIESALFIEAEQIIGGAKQIVPVDLGALKGSGHVMLPVSTPTSVKIEFGFGGPAGIGNHGGETNGPTENNPTGDVGYAVTVHEDLEAFHKVGQAKYLTTIMDQRRSGMAQRIGRRAARRARSIASRAR